MDARGVMRLLERIQGLADTAEHVGSMYVETMQREPRLSDAAKAKLAPLYREHALRLIQLHSSLGLAICDVIENEIDDDNARAQLDLMCANLRTFRDDARTSLASEIGESAKLE